MTNKEFKEYWSKKTLGEIRGYYEEKLRILNNIKSNIQSSCKELINLDLDNKYYGQ